MTDAALAGQAYLVLPEGGQGPGVLVLHSWWGLTDFFRGFCDRLADDGFVVLAPDLLGGRRPTTGDEAETVLAELDMNRTVDLVLSSAATLRNLRETPGGGVGVVGFSMGASLGLWLASRAPEQVRALVFFYGSQDIQRLDITAAVQGHFAQHDAFMTDEERVLLEAGLHLGGIEVDIHDYPGTQHWFVEADRPQHDSEAAALAWGRTVAFLHAHLDPEASQ